MNGPKARMKCGGGRWRRALLAAAVGVGLLGLPKTALAHAHLKRSEPGAGARFAVAPTRIRLWFTEAPELALTTVTLLDSSGTTVSVGAVERDPDGEMAVRVAIIGAVGPGRYQVRWRTAAADGHPSSGVLGFVVLAAARDSTVVPAFVVPVVAPPVAPPSVATPDADSLTPAWVVARAVSFLALIGVIGAVTFRIAVLSRASDIDHATHRSLSSAIAGRAAALCVVFLLAAAAKLYLQNRMMSGPEAADLAHMRTMSMETHWGWAWRLQFGAGAVALTGFIVAWRRIAAGWVLAALACVALAASAALGGHAAAAQHWRALAVTTDAVHVVAASGWLGSLLWLVVVGLAVVQRSGSGRASRAASLVRAFSSLALACAALVVLTGVASAWLRLGTLPPLWTTAYGQTLLVKLLFLSGVIGTGFYNWRVVQPALGSDIGTGRLRRSATIELLIGVMVIVVTAVLVALPTPLEGMR